MRPKLPKGFDYGGLVIYLSSVRLGGVDSVWDNLRMALEYALTTITRKEEEEKKSHR